VAKTFATKLALRTDEELAVAVVKTCIENSINLASLSGGVDFNYAHRRFTSLLLTCFDLCSSENEMIQELVRTYIVDIGSPAINALGNIEVLLAYLEAHKLSISSARMQLSLAQAVAELEKLPQVLDTEDSGNARHNEIDSRVRLIIYAVNESSDDERCAVETNIWEVLIGGRAVSNSARSHALAVWTRCAPPGSPSGQFLYGCIIQYLPVLPVRFAIPDITLPFDNAFVNTGVARQTTVIRVWREQLLRFCFQSSDERLVEAFVLRLFDLLYYRDTKESIEDRLNAQITAAEKAIDFMSSSPQCARRGVRILLALLSASESYERVLSVGSMNKPLGEMNASGDAQHKPMQTDIDKHDKTSNVAVLTMDASANSSAVELRSAISQLTGFAEFKVFTAGREVPCTDHCGTSLEVLKALGTARMVVLNHNVLLKYRYDGFWAYRTSVGKALSRHLAQLCECFTDDQDLSRSVGYLRNLRSGVSGLLTTFNRCTNS